MKNIVTDALSQIPNNENQNTTHESNYTMEAMPEINDKEKLSEDTFPVKFKIIDQYQWKYPGLMDKF